MIIWIYLFYIQFDCIFKILIIFIFNNDYLVSITFYKTFGTISSRQYWEGVTLEHELGDTALLREALSRSSTILLIGNEITHGSNLIVYEQQSGAMFFLMNMY